MHGETTARLCRVLMDRPRWQRIAAFLVSAWTFAWIGGQFLAPEGATALAVLRKAGAWLGAEPVPWVYRALEAMQGPERRQFAFVLAVVGGLAWAATTERGQMSALFGWLAVMFAAAGLGYRPAVITALAALGGFVGLLWLLSLAGRQRFVDRRPALLSEDVLRAGATAVTLSVAVPLIAPGVVFGRLCRPYVTWPPRPRVPDERDSAGEVSGYQGPNPRKPRPPRPLEEDAVASERLF